MERVAGVEASDPTVSRMLGRRVGAEKRSVGATERDEFMRVAWRALVAEGIEARRSVFVSERVVQRHATGKERHVAFEHEYLWDGTAAQSGRIHHR